MGTASWKLIDLLEYSEYNALMISLDIKIRTSLT